MHNIHYITHIICAHCGEDIAVSSVEKSDVITLTQYSNVKYLNFNCPKCKSIYPLPFTNLPF